MLQIERAGLGWWPYDQVKAAAGDVVDAIEDAASWVWNSADDVLDFVQKYGCTVINNSLVVGLAAGGTSLVATPAAGAAVAGGAAAAQQGCKYITVSQAVLDDIKRRSSSVPPPPGITPPVGPVFQSPVSFKPVSVSGSKPAGNSYKIGSFARFNKTRGTFSVYSPLAGGLGLAVSCAGHCLAGECLGDVTPAVPPGFVKVGEEITAAAAAAKNAPVTGEEKDKSLFSSPYFWLGVGGVVLIGGGIVVWRRRRAA